MNKKRRFSEDIADSILDKIKELDLKIGDRLPTHNQLSEMLGVSIPSLREGLCLLNLSGLINITHGAGTTLSEPGAEDYFKILAPALRVKGVDLNDLSAFFHLFIPDFVEVLIHNSTAFIEAVNSIIRAGESGNQKDFAHYHENFYMKLFSLLENTIKTESLSMALNLLYTHDAFVNINTLNLKSYTDAHISLKESLVVRNHLGTAESLMQCLDFHCNVENGLFIAYDRFCTGSLGGSFHSMARRFSRLIKEETGLDIPLVITDGGIENIELISQERSILALTQSDVAESAFHGEGIFEKEHSNLRLICGVKPTFLWIITNNKTKISDLYDLKGRRIAMGSTGGNSSILAKVILEKLGYLLGDYRAYYLSFSKAIDGLATDEIDVVFFLSSEMPPLVSEKSEKIDFKFLELPEEIKSYLTEVSSYWNRATIYPSIGKPGEISSISVSSLLISDSQVPENVIYKIAKTLKNKGSESDQISFDITAMGVDIPLHKGVAKCLQ